MILQKKINCFYSTVIGCILMCFIAICPGKLQAQKVFRIFENRKYQVIHSFGASDAWSDDIIKALKEEKRWEIATLLFSMDTNSSGSFKGIGLNLWRFNLGAGSTEQGDSSKIFWYRRRTESFLNLDGSYNWNKQSGHIWMLNAAKAFGVNERVMFANSPHVIFTKNGKAWGNRESKYANLRDDKYDEFSSYLVNCAAHFDSIGLHFNYISPVNEPQWNWSNREGQEGSAWLNSEIAKLVRSLDRKIEKRKLTSKILISESGTLFCLIPGIKVRPGRQNQIVNFFNKHRKNYVGNLPTVAKIIAGHSYWTVWPLWWSRMVRKSLSQQTHKYGLQFWMSEYCVLEKYRELSNAGKEYDMRTANIVSGVIFHDLFYGNATSWQFWTAIEGGDGRFSLVNTNGDSARITTTKTLWAIGNYSRFLRPGAVRIGVNGNHHKKLFVSAYLNGNDLVIVVVNKSDNEAGLKLKGLSQQGVFRAYETSETKDLLYVGNVESKDILKFPKRSTTTLLMHRK